MVGKGWIDGCWVVAGGCGYDWKINKEIKNMYKYMIDILWANGNKIIRKLKKKNDNGCWFIYKINKSVYKRELKSIQFKFRRKSFRNTSEYKTNKMIIVETTC
mgnify:CR=1 FL=1